MRTGLPWSAATWQMVVNCSSRRLPVPTLPGLIRYLSSALAQSGVFRQQEVTVVVEVADERRGDAGVEHALLDRGHSRRGLGQIHGDAHELGAGLRELDALPRGRLDVRRVGVRHRLDGNRSTAADLNRPDLYANGFMKPDGSWQRLRRLPFTVVTVNGRRYGYAIIAGVPELAPLARPYRQASIRPRAGRRRPRAG